MKKVYIKGYINYEDEDYTFIYENKKLNLISIKNKYTFCSEYKYVKEFKGYTVDGLEIVFYINNSIFYKNGCFVCSPRCIIIARDQSYSLATMKFNALRISGGLINRFYSNRNLIGINPDIEGGLGIGDIKESIVEETVTLNKKESIFEFSIMKPGWKDDGIITINNYDSLLRVKYKTENDYATILNDLDSIESFFKFCANRENTSFEEIYLEIINKDGKYAKACEIIIPFMTDIENNKDILDYFIFKDHLNGIFEFLNKCDYIFSIIPEDNKKYGIISNKDYCACFSCFESIYQYVYGNIEKIVNTKEENALYEVKEELLPILEKLDEKYKGNNRLKREFIKRFKKIISTANLKLETNIQNMLENNKFIFESIYYARRNAIKEKGIFDSVAKAVEDRDNITHNNTIKLDDVSIGIYETILKLNYVMIFDYIGISKEIYSEKIKSLGLLNII